MYHETMQVNLISNQGQRTLSNAWRGGQIEHVFIMETIWMQKAYCETDFLLGYLPQIFLAKNLLDAFQVLINKVITSGVLWDQ